MKSLKALENKYTLIREAATPPTTATTTAPTTSAAPVAAPTTSAAPVAAPVAAPTTSAAPVAAPVAQSSILTPEELKSLTAAGIPVEPSKINAIVKNPQQLSDIINGLVASIAETNPEALKELLDAAKTNDSNKVNNVLAKYAKLAPAAPAAPAATTGESAKLNEGIPEKLYGIADKVFGDTGVVAKAQDYVEKNPKKIATHLALGALGAMTVGSSGAVLLPVVAAAAAAAIKRSGGGLKGLGTLAANFIDQGKDKKEAITKQITSIPAWEYLKKQIINNNQYNPRQRVDNAPVGTNFPELAKYLEITLTPQEVKKITEQDVPLNLSSPSEATGTEQFQIIKERGVYRIYLTAYGDGKIWRELDAAIAAKPATTPSRRATTRTAKKTVAADPAAAAAAKAKADEEEKMLGTSYTPFASLANKVLKEFHKNSKPLPIEVANKK